MSDIPTIAGSTSRLIHASEWHALCRLLCSLALCFVFFSAMGESRSEGIRGVSNDELRFDLWREEVARLLVSGKREEVIRLIKDAESRPNKSAGDWLDIAMLYCEAGDGRAAERVFSLIEVELMPPPSIQQLIGITRSVGCDKRETFGKAVTGISLSAGWTDNANLGPRTSTIRFSPLSPLSELTLLPGYVAKPDGFVALEAHYDRPGQHEGAFDIFSSFKARNYDSSPDFSYQQVQAGIVKQKSFGGFDSEGSAAVSMLVVGGSPYEAMLAMQGGTWFPSVAGENSNVQFGIDTLASLFKYPRNLSFNSAVYELRLKARMNPSRTTSLLAAVGVVRDHAFNDRLGGDRDGISLNVRSITNLTDDQSLTVFVTKQSLRDQEVYSAPIFGSVSRKPTSSTYGFRWQLKIGGNGSVYAQVSRHEREDTIELFSFRSSIVMLGSQWKW